MHGEDKHAVVALVTAAVVVAFGLVVVVGVFLGFSQHRGKRNTVFEQLPSVNETHGSVGRVDAQFQCNGSFHLNAKRKGIWWLVVGIW